MTVDIIDNTFIQWKNVGIDFYQSANAQVSCNTIVSGQKGINIWRNGSQTGAAIRFRENRIEATLSNSNFFAIKTNEAVETKLGPDDEQAGLGKNELAVNLTLTPFIVENDGGTSDVLRAEENYWFTYDTAYSQVDEIGEAAVISGRLVPPDNIVFQPFQMDPPGESNCESHGILRLAAGVYQEAVSSAATGDLMPTVLSLGLVRPNPGRGVAIDLSVPLAALGEYSLGVFDLRGRKVYESRSMVESPGRYVLEWRGDNGQGRAAAGVYFLSIQGPEGFRETRKAVILQ